MPSDIRFGIYARRSNGVRVDLSCEPRHLMRLTRDDEVWIKGMAPHQELGEFRIIDIRMTCSDALELAMELLGNIGHHMSTDLELQSLRERNQQKLDAALYQKWYGGDKP